MGSDRRDARAGYRNPGTDLYPLCARCGESHRRVAVRPYHLRIGHPRAVIAEFLGEPNLRGRLLDMSNYGDSEFHLVASFLCCYSCFYYTRTESSRLGARFSASRSTSDSYFVPATKGRDPGSRSNGSTIPSSFANSRMAGRTSWPSSRVLVIRCSSVSGPCAWKRPKMPGWSTSMISRSFGNTDFGVPMII